jgi:dethiobiotin synthetase
MQTWFVTGTDTEIGKTTVTAALLRQIQAEHKVGVGLKPVASDAMQTPAGLRNQDALTLMASNAISLPYEVVNPIVFEPAIAPHIAAIQSGAPLTVQAVVKAVESAYQAFVQPVDAVFIEGAGGWRVPINHQQWFSDIPKALNCPLLLVVGMRLGCINHALLTTEAIVNDGLSLSGWIANRIDPEMNAFEDNFQTLARNIPAPCLGILPYLNQVTTPLESFACGQGNAPAAPCFDLKPLGL